MTADGVQSSGPGLYPGASRSGRSLWLVALIALLAILCVLSVAVGTRAVAWPDIVAALGGQVDSIGQAAVAVRIPRTLLAVLAGAALGLAGAIMQGVTRNPLADPGILGVNMGASLAVVIGVAWFNIASAQAYIWVAVLGAGASAVFVYTIGSLGRGGATPLKLALAGAATSIAFSSLVIAVVLPRSDIAGGIRSWQIGGVGGATFERIGHVLPFLAVGFAISLLSARKLNSLALGDDLAAGLGERVAVARALIGQPPLIVADEPTSALEAAAQDSFLGLLFDQIAATGASLLMVSHDERLGARFDRVLRLADIASTERAAA